MFPVFWKMSKKACNFELFTANFLEKKAIEIRKIKILKGEFKLLKTLS